jgi:hypothetical protein
VSPGSARILRVAIVLITTLFVVMMFLPLVREIIGRTGMGQVWLP